MAFQDFSQVKLIQPRNGLGHLGLGDSLKGLNRIQESLESYTNAIQNDTKSSSQGLLKRGLLYLQLKQNQKAIDDFNQLA